MKSTKSYVVTFRGGVEFNIRAQSKREAYSYMVTAYEETHGKPVKIQLEKTK